MRESVGLSANDGKRPDLQIVFPSRHIITDVVISHSLAPSYIGKANDNTAATAEYAAGKKTTKYTEVSDTQHATFIPFACETTGGMSAGARELLKQIAIAGYDHLCLDPRIKAAKRESVDAWIMKWCWRSVVR